MERRRAARDLAIRGPPPDFPTGSPATRSAPTSSPGGRCLRRPGGSGVRWRPAGRQRPRQRASRERRRGQALGFIVLVHDLSFVERREAHAAHSPSDGVRGAAALRIGHYHRGSPPVVAELEQRAAPAAARRARKAGVPARPARRPRAGGAVDYETRRGAGGLDAATAEERLERHLHGERVVIVANREPYIHERSADGEHHRAAPGERSGHGARAGDACVLGGLDRARQRQRRSRDRGRARRVRGPAGRATPTRCGACGSPRRRSAATTTASRTRACGRCATSPTRGPTFRLDDWTHYQAVNRSFADAVCEEVDARRPDRPRAGLSLRARSRS